MLPMIQSQVEAEMQYKQRINNYTITGLIATIVFSVGAPLTFLYVLSLF